MEQTTTETQTEPGDANDTHPAGEILLSPRSRVGARVSALSGVAFVALSAVAATISIVPDTTSSSHF